jgi:putative membrane protein
VIGGAFQYFDPLIDRVLEHPEDYRLPTREQAERYGLYLTISLALIILFLGVVTGLLRTVARDYRFRLTRAPNGLRRQRGLFTLSEVIIPFRRVQVAVVESGILRRRLGWWSLDLQTLSADAHQSGRQDAAPFARMEEILPILAETGLDAPPDESAYRYVSRRTVGRRLLSLVVPVVLITMIAGLLVPLILLLLIPLCAAAAGVALLWRRHRYTFGEGALFVREGVLRPRVWIMPYSRLQSISVRAGPLQRKLALATVQIDTAGASVFQSLSIRDVEVEESRSLALRLLRERRLHLRSLSDV